MSAPLLITSDSRNSLEWHQKTSIPALDDLDPVAETAESEPEEKPKPTSAKGSFTIQVAAYQVKNKALADKYVESLKKDNGVSADLVKSGDGKYYQVVVGRYADSDAARKAQGELKKKGGFADSIVKDLGK